MTEEITFYYHPYSRGRIAHWMLEEVGAPYRVTLVDFEKGENKKPEFLAINPMGKIPTIVHRGTVVTEAGAICAYLADAFPAARLAPAPGDPERGTYYRWLFFGAGCIEAALIDKMFSRPAPDRPGALGYGSFEDTLNTLEKALAPGPFLVGAHFTAADVYVGSQIGWGLMTKSIEPRQAFLEYVGRCSERPAFKRYIQQNEQIAASLKAKT